MKLSKIRDVKTPTRANSTDAGIDFFIPNDWNDKKYHVQWLKPGESVFIPAGVKVNCPKGFALVAFNKSGVAVKKSLHVGACVVDHGYQGELHLNLTNVGDTEQSIAAGDKIVQFVLLPLGETEVEVVDEKDLFDAVSSRGEGGFGSSGTK